MNSLTANNRLSQQLVADKANFHIHRLLNISGGHRHA